MKRLLAIALLIAVAGCDRPATKAAEPAPAPAPAPLAPPKLAITKLEQLPTPLPKPYDESATPQAVDAAIDAALVRAKAGNKRVILDLGGNWCSWCRSLAGVMALADVKPFIDQNFEVVMVPVSSKQGLTDLNNQVLKRFGVAKVGGVPWVIVLDAEGKVLHSSYEVTDDKHETPQAMVDWLASWAPGHNGSAATVVS
jgi:thiol:disulfide interchange protein